MSISLSLPHLAQGESCDSLQRHPNQIDQDTVAENIKAYANDIQRALQTIDMGNARLTHIYQSKEKFGDGKCRKGEDTQNQIAKHGGAVPGIVEKEERYQSI